MKIYQAMLGLRFIYVIWSDVIYIAKSTAILPVSKLRQKSLILSYLPLANALSHCKGSIDVQFNAVASIVHNVLFIVLRAIFILEVGQWKDGRFNPSLE